MAFTIAHHCSKPCLVGSCFAAAISFVEIRILAMAKDPGRLWKRKSREVLAPPLEESGFDDAAAAFGDDDIEMGAEIPAGAASGAADEDEDGAAADALSSRALEGAAGVADALSSHTPQSPAGVADALSSRAELENADEADALSSQVEHVDVLIFMG